VIGEAAHDIAALSDVPLFVGELEDADPAPGFAGFEMDAEAGSDGVLLVWPTR
jgi:hypothetical protein